MSGKFNFNIQDLLYKFMRSFDDKDFSTMQNCMCDEVNLDYSSFRNEPPSKQKSSEYCRKRKESLETLVTQHNLFNLIIKVNEDNLSANVNCNFIIYRFLIPFSGTKEDFFHSYGQYEFEVKFDNNNWKISSIIQNILMNDGNKNIHKGIKS